jgi:chromate reductase, NAD(P)H dehydrogenase (quinone)
MTAKILAFAGSTRRESFNRKALEAAIEGARSAGADVTRIDLNDFPLPLYDGDLEEREGIPENARRLKDLFMADQGLLIAAPEYNSGITGVLKNTIDWVSRPVQGRPYLAEFSGKVAGLVSASTGALGGVRGLYQLRFTLTNINVLVLPEQATVSSAADAFNAEGKLKDEALAGRVRKVGERLALVTARLHSAA